MTDTLPPADLPLDSDFDWLANVYTRHGAINHPSELHGLVMGEITGCLKRTPSDWLALVLEHMGVDALNTELQANVAEDLIAFYHQAIDTIEQDSSSFNPLLPDDDYVLTERIESLSIWVRGFLEGLSIAASDKLGALDKELQEIIRDLVEICNIDSRVDAGEAGEKEFFEIYEYVRVCVLNLYAEFNTPKVENNTDSAPNSPTLH
jgi:yecA family protein